MGKRAPFSRRKFLGVTIGTLAAASVGCGGDDGSTGTGSTGTGGTGTGGVGTGGVGTGGTGGTGGVGTGGTGGIGAGGTGGTGGVGTGGTGGTGGVGTGGTGGASSGGAEPGTGGASGGTGGTGGDAPLVALVRDSDVIQATQAAILAAGGFPDLTGRVVLLRPNAIDLAPPGCVNPDVIRGVIRAIKARGAPASLVVADDTFTEATLTRMGRNGIAAAAEAEGATCLGLEGGATTLSRPAGAEGWPDGLPFYSAVIAADYVVNIPVCKTHGSANFSMALKAWYGHVPRASRTQSHANVGAISRAQPEMHLVKREDFVVLDATECLLTGGPQVGDRDTVVSPGLVVASRDAIAADVTGLCILRHYLAQTGTSNSRITNTGVWEQPQIARAMELTALGWLTTRQEFTYAAEGVDEVAAIMAHRS